MTAMEKKDKNLNVPNLRFSEFSGEWKKYLLKSITNIYDGTHQTPKYTKSGVPFMSVEDVTQKSSKEQKYISEQDFQNDFRNPPQKGDILMTRIGDIGTPCIVPTNEALGYYVSLALIRPLEKLQSCFLNYAIQSNSFKRELYKRTIHVAFPQKINKEDIGKCKLDVPSIEEQSRIGDLLSLIDERIETQRKIIEDLKKLKDAICNMNFTSGSALKLGNVGKFVRGLTYSASDVIDDTMGTAVMRSNNISNGDPANFEELIWVNKTLNHEQILRGGDIIICMANGSSPLVGKASYYIDCGMESATVGAFCGIYRSYNPLTKWLFQTKHYKKYIQRCIQGGNGAIANIYPEDILAISFNIPSGYERVLNVLNSLEEKYLLEQKLLYRYLAVKSHLLAQLFI